MNQRKREICKFSCNNNSDEAADYGWKLATNKLLPPHSQGEDIAVLYHG